MTDDPLQVDEEQTLADVLPLLELQGFQLLELNGRRLDYDRMGQTSADEAGLVEAEPTAMAIEASQSDERVGVRVQGAVITDSVRVEVTMAASFEKLAPVHVEGRPLGEFIERVAIMAIYPFLRQAVHDMSTRLGAPATLHLLRAGQMTLASDMEDVPPEPRPAAEESS